MKSCLIACMLAVILTCSLHAATGDEQTTATAAPASAAKLIVVPAASSNDAPVDAARTVVSSHLADPVAEFEYPRVADRQERSARRVPGRLQTNDGCPGCRCGFLCNDFGFCNAATGGSCEMIKPDCIDCKICSCY